MNPACAIFIAIYYQNMFFKFLMRDVGSQLSRARSDDVGGWSATHVFATPLVSTIHCAGICKQASYDPVL